MEANPEINRYPPNPNPGRVGPSPPPPSPAVEAPVLDKESVKEEKKSEVL